MKNPFWIIEHKETTLSSRNSVGSGCRRLWGTVPPVKPRIFCACLVLTTSESILRWMDLLSRLTQTFVRSSFLKGNKYRQIYVSVCIVVQWQMVGLSFAEKAEGNMMKRYFCICVVCSFPGMREKGFHLKSMFSFNGWMCLDRTFRI